MKEFYVIQIGAIVIAFFDAKEELAWSWPFRNISETYFQNKKSLSKKAHRFGAANVFCMAVVAGLAAGSVVLGTLVFLFWYWLMFDPIYAIGEGQKWDYLGASAIDSVIKNGKIKALACLIVIVVLNIYFATHATYY